jgi:LacI family transcriptional regulator
MIQRFKLKDVADALGISAATVSLAVNDRPGISPKTRQKVLEYIKEAGQPGLLSQEDAAKSSENGTIVMLNYKKNGLIMNRESSRLPSDHPFYKEMTGILREEGFSFQFLVFSAAEERVEDLLETIRSYDTAGLYIMAAEMSESDMYPFLKLNIPIVTGDQLFYQMGIDSYLIDNREGINRGVDYLVDKGHSHIIYLAESQDIFNFVERRKAFVMEMALRECGDAKNRILHLGCSVDEISANMDAWLDEGLRRTTAFVLESSYVSLGVIRALLARNIRIPKDVSLIGFDAVPEEEIPDLTLTQIKGTHTKRHAAAVRHLISHVKNRSSEIMRVYYRTRIIEGNTVFDKTRFIYR